MPWDDAKLGRVSSHTVWRVLIIGLALLDALTLIGVVWLFTLNRDAIDDTHELSCRIGAFFVGTPIIRQSGTTEHDFKQTVAKAESYLRVLKQQDCSAVKGARITHHDITESLRKLRRARTSPPPPPVLPPTSPQASTAPSGGGGPGSPGGGGSPGSGGSGQPPPPEPTPGPTTTTSVTVCLHALNLQRCLSLHGE